ncbi:hypothetical protein SAMN05216215_10332 [Saccharopolyspora shandongensis]|uniref:Uncharacterized protein n=1 Tax=Saccharopolyspora shandongensis TaxID=418495 RepID=A0A1H3M060_9PSEU|nr:hypothetical protein SAMN05216215_10332 [Saccharopolyspora shandongensis]
MLQWSVALGRGFGTDCLGECLIVLGITAFVVLVVGVPIQLAVVEPGSYSWTQDHLMIFWL